MTYRLRNLTELKQNITVVRPTQTVVHTVFPLNYQHLTDVEYASINPPLVEGVWEIVYNPPDLVPVPPAIPSNLYTTDNLPEGVLNLYYTDARARGASVQDVIVDGVTNKAPSQNVVFDALATKVETASNVGTGESIFKQKVGVNLEFKKLYAGAGITLNSFPTEIEIVATGGGGGSTLNDAYQAGSTITTTGVDGPVTITGTEQVLIQNNGSVIPVEMVQLNIASTLPVLRITQNGTGPTLNLLGTTGALLELSGATSGAVSLKVPAVVTTYSLTLPGAQGGVGTVLTNDGFGTLSWTAGGGGGSQWTTSGLNIYFTGGNVGIGSVLAPTEALEVTGNIQSTSGLDVAKLEHVTGAPQVRLFNSGVADVLLQSTTLASGGDGLKVSTHTQVNGLLTALGGGLRSLASPGTTAASLGAGTLNLWSAGGTGTFISFTETGIGTRGTLGFQAGSADLVYKTGAENITAGTERIRITSGGNVGVGVTPNSSKFHILSSTVSEPTLKLEHTTNNATLLEFKDQAGIPNSWMIGTGTLTPTDGVFRIQDARQTVDRFVIDTVGNIGIGTTIPGSKLTISDPNVADTVTITHSAASGKGIDLNLTNAANVANALDITVAGAGTGVRAVVSGAGIGVHATSADIGVIAETTSVGTSAAIRTLSSTTRHLQMFDTGGTNSIVIRIPSSVTTHDLTLPAANAAGVLTNPGTGVLTWSAPGVGIGGAVSGGTVGSLLFVGAGTLVAQDSANLFWDDTNNRLGLGTTTPGATLHVDGAVRQGSSSQFVENTYVHSTTLTASTTAVAPAFTFAFATYDTQVIEYKIKEASTNAVRVGHILVATDGSSTTITDTHTETANIGVVWSAAINGANVELSYTTTANAKTMRAAVKKYLT